MCIIYTHMCIYIYIYVFICVTKFDKTMYNSGILKATRDDGKPVHRSDLSGLLFYNIPVRIVYSILMSYKTVIPDTGVLGGPTCLTATCLSNAASLVFVFVVVSKIATICKIICRFRRKPALDKQC